MGDEIKKKQTEQGCIGCLGVIVLVALFAWFTSSGTDDSSSPEQQVNEQQVKAQKEIIQETINKFRETNFLKKIDGPGRTYYVNNTMWNLINAEKKENLVTWLARHAGYFHSNVNEAVGITVKDWQSGKTIAEYSVWSGVTIK